MAAPTNTADVKKTLANSEPSTHGPSATSTGWAMTRSRSGTGDETIKARRRRAATLNRCNETKPVPEHSTLLPICNELDRRTRERYRAIERQSANSEVLRGH
jgi:hypothetical protein